jgi:hypothetical protein
MPDSERNETSESLALAERIADGREAPILLIKYREEKSESYVA